MSLLEQETILNVSVGECFSPFSSLFTERHKSERTGERACAQDRVRAQEERGLSAKGLEHCTKESALAWHFDNSEERRVYVNRACTRVSSPACASRLSSPRSKDAARPRSLSFASVPLTLIWRALLAFPQISNITITTRKEWQIITITTPERFDNWCYFYVTSCLLICEVFQKRLAFLISTRKNISLKKNIVSLFNYRYIRNKKEVNRMSAL